MIHLSIADQFGLFVSVISCLGYVGFIRAFNRSIRVKPYAVRPQRTRRGGVR